MPDFFHGRSCDSWFGSLTCCSSCYKFLSQLLIVSRFCFLQLLTDPRCFLCVSSELRRQLLKGFCEFYCFLNAPYPVFLEFVPGVSAVPDAEGFHSPILGILPACARSYQNGIHPVQFGIHLQVAEEPSSVRSSTLLIALLVKSSCSMDSRTWSMFMSCSPFLQFLHGFQEWLDRAIFFDEVAVKIFVKRFGFLR